MRQEGDDDLDRSCTCCIVDTETGKTRGIRGLIIVQKVIIRAPSQTYTLGQGRLDGHRRITVPNHKYGNVVLENAKHIFDAKVAQQLSEDAPSSDDIAQSQIS